MQEEKNFSGGSRSIRQMLWEFIPLSFIGTTLAYCVMLYLLSSVSSFPVPSPFAFFDKVVHFFLFAGLSAVVSMGLHQARHRYSSRTQILFPVSFSIIYGLSDEIHQLIVPFRQFSMWDLAADAVGATAAATALFLVYQWRKSGR